MPVFVPTALISEELSRGETIVSVDITVYYTGSIQFQITADADSASPTWDEVTLTSGTKTTHTFTTSGSVLKYRIIGVPGSKISTQKNADESLSAPGIKIKINYS